MSELPFKLTNFNLFIDGKGFAGIVEELELPKIEFQTESYRSGGMDAPLAIEMGMNELEANYTLGSYEPEVFRLMGFRAGLPVVLIARGALKRHEEVIPITVTISGQVTSVDMGSWKAGDNTSMQFAVKCSYYRLDRGVENLIEIDVKNLIRRFGGVDQLEAIRQALFI